MIHLAAFYEAGVASGTMTTISPVTDETLTVASDKLFYSSDLRVIAAYARADTLSQARLVTDRRPVARDVLTNVRPLTSATAAQADPNLAVYLRHPLLLRKGDGLLLEATQTSGVAKDIYGLVWVSDALAAAPESEIITLRGTHATPAVTANVWTVLTITWDSLRPGTYAILGSEVFSTNAIAHRWICDGSAFHPGALSQAGPGDRTHDLFYAGELGQWGRFDQRAMPRLQVLCSAADASHTIFLHVTRIG
jgi:hypothetical protein